MMWQRNLPPDCTVAPASDIRFLALLSSTTPALAGTDVASVIRHAGAGAQGCGSEA